MTRSEEQTSFLKSTPGVNVIDAQRIQSLTSGEVERLGEALKSCLKKRDGIVKESKYVEQVRV
jgi:hypothetical protein